MLKGQAVGKGPNRRLIVAHDLIERLSEKLGLSLTALGSMTGAQLAGCQYRHPLFDRTSPVVIGGDYITTESGTGLVHTAPGHGQEDYQVRPSDCPLSPCIHTPCIVSQPRVTITAKWHCAAGYRWVKGKRRIVYRLHIAAKVGYVWTLWEDPDMSGAYGNHTKVTCLLHQCCCTTKRSWHISVCPRGACSVCMTVHL